MDEKTRRMFTEMLTHDREWAEKVFSEPGVVRDAAERGGLPLPDHLGQIIGNFIAKEQVDDLSDGIRFLNSDQKCINPSLKKYLLTILENDSEWFIRSKDIGYSEFNTTSEEICQKIESGLEELRGIPSCQQI